MQGYTSISAFLFPALFLLFPSFANGIWTTALISSRRLGLSHNATLAATLAKAALMPTVIYILGRDTHPKRTLTTCN